MKKLCLIFAAFVLSACERAPVVDANGESLVGMYVEDGKVAAFLGVPFAEPPVGELRWRAPQPLQHKRGKRDVTEFAPACIQSMRILDWYRGLAVDLGGTADYYEDLEVSEDCLYLNIWTPQLESTTKLPVMVWVHGGSNKSGWSYEPNYYGHKLAQQDVVVVSVAYRQGMFGFLSHPELPRDEPVANFAYWDLITSLQWIQENIEQFGGDPNRVTMFGESAGAENILALMAIEQVEGMLHRGVAQSTAGFGLTRMSTLAEEEERALGLADALDIPREGSLAALREVPADEIFAVYDEVFASHYHAPAIDNQLLTESTWKTIQSGALLGRELIIGSNYHEWYASTAEDTTWDDVIREGAKLIEGIDYESALEVVRDEEDPRRALDRLRTASSMLCASQNVAARVNAAGGNAWMYHFTRVPRGLNGESLGAYHGVEYPYVFDTHDPFFATDDKDRALQRAMQTYWVNFARSGDPNGDGVTHWPRFGAPHIMVQELGDEVFTTAQPEPELCALFEEGLVDRTIK
ncbi:MAG: carboxylesterase/lipase family protein [Woeseiaceae bacterium]